MQQALTNAFLVEETILITALYKLRAEASLPGTTRWVCGDGG